jgi:Hsp20/alpha crystallin family
MATAVEIPVNIRSTTEDSVFDTSLRQQSEALDKMFRQTSEDLWNSLGRREDHGDLWSSLRRREDDDDLGWTASSQLRHMSPLRLFDTSMRGSSRAGSRSSSLVRGRQVVETVGGSSDEENAGKSSGARVHEVKIRGTDQAYRSGRESRPAGHVRKSGTGAAQTDKNYAEIEGDQPLVHNVEIVEAKQRRQQKEERRESSASRIHEVEIKQNKEILQRRENTGTKVHNVEIHSAPSSLQQKKEVQIGRNTAENHYRSSSQAHHQVVINRSSDEETESKMAAVPRVHHVEIRREEDQKTREFRQEERRKERNLSCERRVEIGQNVEETEHRIPVHNVKITRPNVAPRNCQTEAESREEKRMSRETVSDESREDKRMSRETVSEQREKRRASLVRQEVIQAAERRKELQVHPVVIHNVEAEGRKQQHQADVHQVEEIQQKKHHKETDVRIQKEGQAETKIYLQKDNANCSRQNLLAEIRSRGGRASSRSRSSSRNREQMKDLDAINQAETLAKVFKSHDGRASRQEFRYQKEERRNEQRRQENKEAEPWRQEFRQQENQSRESTLQENRRSRSASREVKIQQVDERKQEEEAATGRISDEFLLPWTGDSLASKDDIFMGMEQTEKGLVISLNTQGFKPSELAVRVAENQLLVVEGLHEERAESGQLMVRRQLRRGYRLPAGTRPERVVSDLGQDGVLRITVPREVSSSRPVNVQIVET